ncbi:hypothetical protein [Niveispirillum cyanobacteriorum]|nr:hypothetical protein [Niveispirillum cyanobacteriorum]
MDGPPVMAADQMTEQQNSTGLAARAVGLSACSIRRGRVVLAATLRLITP